MAGLPDPPGSHRGASEATIVGWSINENFVQLKPALGQFKAFRAPLDDVVSVSLNIDGIWQIRPRGSMRRLPAPTDRVIFGYHPAV